MLQAFLIYLSKASWAKHIVTRWYLAWSVASRFIAGETIKEAVQVIKELNKKGIFATLAYLGESVTDQEEAHRAMREIIRILEEINQSGIKSSVSIKPSQIGLVLSPDLYVENLRLILQKAKELNNFIRIDMEDSSFTEITLSTFRMLVQEGYSENLGIVIQSYLYRSAKDIYELLENFSRIRLCKGAYKEASDIAFTKKTDTNRNFDVLTEMLISGALIARSPTSKGDGSKPPIPAIASHDNKRIEYAKTIAKQMGLPKGALEFQMLNGIRRELQESLVAEGFPVRVYVPYGTEWFPYFMRRLAERPANLWFFISNIFRN